ncbi:GCN5-related N-acetyltransferas-like protein [Melanomma pulvis-pyrius CBS 109.77]|uniref:GCN5-related N-acetyltransferas-like protein n=1 Tax=Melanomma pulvis-pyrius CBS 109.77 TaxID=1314802 RepID=A0A6A6WVA8_9PLEO|nr:GCN5-related N-acetyltransferas-like protein [Melanomma pulvis-pyrius CBS 109.77]
MASDGATIRHATREDVPIILALIHELAAYENATSSVHATEELLLKNLSFDDKSSTSPEPSFTPGHAKTLLIVAPEGEVCGMGLYFYNFSTWTGTPGIYLEDLYIKPTYRKRGYGKALIKRLAQEVIKAGGSRLAWVCLNWNKPSLEFYASLGATRMNEWVGLRLTDDALTKVAES